MVDKKNRRSVLNVELTKIVSKNQSNKMFSINKDNLSDARANDGMVEVEELEIVPHIQEDEFEHEKINEEAVAPPVVNEEWDDGIDMILHQEFATKDDVRDLVDKGCRWYLRVMKKTHTCSRGDASVMKKKKRGRPSLVASVVNLDYPGQYKTPDPKTLISLVKNKLGVNEPRNYTLLPMLDVIMGKMTEWCFQIDRYSCVHALAAIMARGDMAENYCSKYYTKEQWSLAYYMTIYPVPHHSTWESFEIPEEIRSKVVFPSLRIWRKRKEDYKLLDSHLHENIIGRKRVGIHHWLVRMTKVTVISMKMREVLVLWMFLCNVLLLLGTTGKPSDMFPAGNMSSTTDTTGNPDTPEKTRLAPKYTFAEGILEGRIFTPF
uniref:Uncharacterized protein n=1 Tax=Brassica oleracea var. oleracea TaxID=109376 RepID=A0A0D3BUD9_BRAOL